MLDQESTSRVVEVAREIQLAIQDVPLAATGPEIADALQMIALAAAEKVIDRRSIARTLMLLSERYLKAEAEARGETEPDVVAAHRAFTAASEILAQQGVPQPDIREMMLGFAAQWMCNADGPRQAAAVLYRHADVLAGRVPTQH